MPKYGNSNTYVDDSIFQKRARALAKRLGLEEGKFVKEQTGLLARDLARMTPPYVSYPKLSGSSIGTAKDIKAGEWAIYGDLKNICQVVKPGVARWAHEQFKDGAIYNGKFQVGKGVLTSLNDMKVWHRSKQNFRGRTNYVLRQDSPWVSENIFDAYFKVAKTDAGKAKASFYKASLLLGAKGAAVAGIKRHVATANGSGKMTKTGKGPVGNVSAREKGIFHTIGVVPRIQKNRLMKAVNRLEYLNGQMARKWNYTAR